MKYILFNLDGKKPTLWQHIKNWCWVNVGIKWRDRK